MQADRHCAEDLEDLRSYLNNLLGMIGPVMFTGGSEAAKAALGRLLDCFTASGKCVEENEGGSQGSMASVGVGGEEAWSDEGRFPLSVLAGSESEEGGR